MVNQQPHKNEFIQKQEQIALLRTLQQRLKGINQKLELKKNRLIECDQMFKEMDLLYRIYNKLPYLRIIVSLIQVFILLIWQLNPYIFLTIPIAFTISTLGEFFINKKLKKMLQTYKQKQKQIKQLSSSIDNAQQQI